MEPRFGHDFSQVRVTPVPPGILQARLVVGKPGDRFEQEADLVADRVMRSPVLEVSDQSRPPHQRGSSRSVAPGEQTNGG